jgi:signal transduction histidine kinase
VGLLHADLGGWLQWTTAAGTSAIWYGFLLALIAAQLFSGRMLREVVGTSMRGSSPTDLERRLQTWLGDPGLRLGLWRSRNRHVAGADQHPLRPEPGQTLSEFECDGRPAVAILHDAQLSDEPELLSVAGRVALLWLENEELEASLHGLVASRARLAAAGDGERRRLERDLHDGAQQRLMAIQIKLRVAQERADDDALAAQLAAIGMEAEQAVEELRRLAHGIYPPGLRAYGLPDALRSFAMTAPVPITVRDEGIGRCARTVEAAIYFCSMEAVQNAQRRSGRTRITITLGRDRERVRFAVTDEGMGMDTPTQGDGILAMRDRIGAVGGELEIATAPAGGTTVEGTVPLDLEHTR